MYECVTGRVPFAKDVNAAVIWAHVEEMPTTPSSLQPTLPAPSMRSSVRRSPKTPADRYATCRRPVGYPPRGAIGAQPPPTPAPPTPPPSSAGPAAAAAAATAAARPRPPSKHPVTFPRPNPAWRASGHRVARRLRARHPVRGQAAGQHVGMPPPPPATPELTQRTPR